MVADSDWSLFHCHVFCTTTFFIAIMNWVLVMLDEMGVVGITCEHTCGYGVEMWLKVFSQWCEFDIWILWGMCIFVSITIYRNLNLLCRIHVLHIMFSYAYIQFLVVFKCIYKISCVPIHIVYVYSSNHQYLIWY